MPIKKLILKIAFVSIRIHTKAAPIKNKHSKKYTQTKKQQTIQETPVQAWQKLLSSSRLTINRDLEFFVASPADQTDQADRVT